METTLKQYSKEWRQLLQHKIQKAFSRFFIRFFVVHRQNQFEIVTHTDDGVDYRRNDYHQVAGFDGLAKQNHFGKNPAKIGIRPSKAMQP